MIRYIWNSILIIVLISVNVGCKIRKPAVTVEPLPAVIELSDRKLDNIKLLKSKDVLFNTLSIKAKVNLDIGGNKNNVTMNIRMEKDRQIWVSITAIAGIEVARALITPDSLKVRNNLQAVYLKKPFSYIHRFSNKQVNFQWLQSILSGNVIADFLTEQSTIEQENGVWALNGEKESLAYRVLFNSLMKVSESNVNDMKTAQALKIVYTGEYQNIGGTLFPGGLTVNSMAGTQNVNINLEYANIERNLPLDFPFSVPKKYAMIN